MCQSEHISADAKPSEDFPFQNGTYDAHCHPTDNMASLSCLATMKATAMVVMATRSQDQELVADAASSHGGINSKEDLRAIKEKGAGGQCKVIPAFGWHPWFSHHLYDDTTASPPSYDPSSAGSTQEAKRAHYRAVLQPTPTDDAFTDELPDPKPLSELIAETRTRLTAHPSALVGEVGLDRPFRLPKQWTPEAVAACDPGVTPGGRQGRLLSQYRVDIAHQQAVMNAQLRLAGEMKRAASVHGVQAHGILHDSIVGLWKGQEKHIPSRREKRMVAEGAEDFSSSSEDDSDDEFLRSLKPKKKTEDTNKAFFPPRICLHSYSGSPDLISQWMKPTYPADIYVSLSSAVNLSTEATRSKIDDVIRALADDRILVESDLDCAGDVMDACLEEMYRRVCSVKGWDLADGVSRIAANFEAFVFG